MPCVSWGFFMPLHFMEISLTCVLYVGISYFCKSNYNFPFFQIFFRLFHVFIACNVDTIYRILPLLSAKGVCKQKHEKINTICLSKKKSVTTESIANRTDCSLWLDVGNGVNCNVEFAILCSEKEFSKNSSLVTRNAVNGWDIEAYSVNLSYTTRHHTHYPNRCILLRM